MKYLILIAVIVALYIIGYYLPDLINKRFCEVYGCEIWSRPLAVIEGICLSVFLLMVDNDGAWFWITLFLMVASYIGGICFTISNYRITNASTKYLVLGIGGQILSSLALAFIILMIVSVLINSDSKKNRRRK
ncbi:MAG: hypothetical protein Q4E51_09730 [Lachnospiraceae bacterium]|nr:hypothetical protein [Lachnospiraceae bacterium]